MMYEEEITHEMLEECLIEQERLIAEGKMIPPTAIDGLSEEGWAAVKRGYTLEMFKKDMFEKFGLE